LEGVPAIVDLVKDKGGKPETWLPFYGGKVPAAEAALAIGPMPRAMDCGDLHEEAGHISEYIVASLLAGDGLEEERVRRGVFDGSGGGTGDPHPHRHGL